MRHLRKVFGVALFAVGLAGCDSEAEAAAPGPKPLTLPDSETAVAMTPPVLPVRIAGDCPSFDICEFGTNWRVCEIIPVYREARDGAALLRTLKADETFVAEGGEIELVAPGEVEMLGASSPEQTGGMALAKGLKIAVYGPMSGNLALYFDPASGKGWSPAPGSHDFWRDDKIAKLTRAPAMTWWLKAKLGDGSSGWLQLKSVPDLLTFPDFYPVETMQAWDVDRMREDESPDCAGMIEIKQLLLKK